MEQMLEVWMGIFWDAALLWLTLRTARRAGRGFVRGWGEFAGEQGPAGPAAEPPRAGRSPARPAPEGRAALRAVSRPRHKG